MASILVLAGGCSLAAPEKILIRVDIPKSASKPSASARAASASVAKRPGSAYGEIAPASFGEFNCFGLSVSGPGIEPDSRLGCSDSAAGAGIVGGFAPASEGAIEMDVPAGAGRVIRLFAVKSSVGCPKLEDLLAAKASGDHGAFAGVGEPYVVGEGVTDIYQDTVISLRAGFDPANPRRLFDGCHDDHGGGDSGPVGIPPTAVYKSEIVAALPSPSPSPSPYGSPSPTPLFLSSPSLEPGAADLPGAVALGSAELEKLSYFEKSAPGTSAPVEPSGSAIHSAAGTSSSDGRRAVMQLQWDVTDIDFAASPYFSIELQYGGGAENDCMPGAPGVKPGLYLPSQGLWKTSHEHRWPGYLGWSSFYETGAAAAVTKSDGRKYLVVNLESAFVSTSSSCPSQVAVAGAALRLSPAPFPLRLHPENAVVPAGSSYYFGANGGLPPYSFSIASGGGSITPYGYFVAPGTQGTVSVRVTDSQTPAAVAEVSVTIGPPSHVSLPFFGWLANTGTAAWNATVSGPVPLVAPHPSPSPYAASSAAVAGERAGIELAWEVPAGTNLGAYSAVQLYVGSAAGGLGCSGYPDSGKPSGVELKVWKADPGAWSTLTAGHYYSGTSSLNLTIPSSELSKYVVQATVGGVTRNVIYARVESAEPATATDCSVVRVDSYGYSPPTAGLTMQPSPPYSWIQVSGPYNAAKDACVPYKVSLGTSDVATTRQVTVTSSGSGQIYSDSSCTQADSTVDIPAGSLRGVLYFKDTVAEYVTLTSSAGNGSPSSHYLTVFQAQLRLYGPGGFYNYAGTCVQYTVERIGSYGSSYSDEFSVPVALSDASGSGQFYTDSGCSSSAGSVTIPANSSYVSFYYKPTSSGVSGSTSLGASAPAPYASPSPLPVSWSP